MRTLLIGVIAACITSSTFAQKLTVKIVGRQDNETDYTYVVPGYSSSNSNTNLNCSTDSTNVNCNGSTTTNGVITLPHPVSYHVRGATLTLQLPDGRVAIVNCESKFKERMAGPQGNHRSCRVPLVDEIEAEFTGDKAKLKWSVSIDGKKLTNETYKILGVLAKK